MQNLLNNYYIYCMHINVVYLTTFVYITSISVKIFYFTLYISKDGARNGEGKGK